MGPKTEPCGTPVDSGFGGDVAELMVTLCDRDCKYEINHFKASSIMPKRFSSLLMRMVWSIVSKAADKSRRHKITSSNLYDILLLKVLNPVVVAY